MGWEAYHGLPLENRHVVLGVTGSIAAYKAADLASKLRQSGATVEVVMTPAATEFVRPLVFKSLTGLDVVVDMFAAAETEAHVEVARRASAMVIAPATANCMANLAHGATPDMVTLTALATTAPLVIAPAMDNQMWEHPATQDNVRVLRERGAEVVGPAIGRLATGREGAGRLAEPAEVIGALRSVLGKRDGDLSGRHIVVSAGGTHEPFDPVRFVGNRSTGKMGFAVAEAARDRGARVTLVAGPVALPTPSGVHRVDVSTAAEMFVALEQACATAEAIVMAAAPADFSPSSPSAHKVKKAPGQQGLTIELEKTPDIIASIPGGGVRVGFAAETRDLAAYAREKIPAKRLHFIVANDVGAEGSGFGTETNQVTFFHDDGRVEAMPLAPKYVVAHWILDRVVSRMRPA